MHWKCSGWDWRSYGSCAIQFCLRQHDHLWPGRPIHVWQDRRFLLHISHSFAHTCPPTMKISAVIVFPSHSQATLSCNRPEDSMPCDQVGNFFSREDTIILTKAHTGKQPVQWDWVWEGWWGRWGREKAEKLPGSFFSIGFYVGQKDPAQEPSGGVRPAQQPRREPTSRAGFQIDF